VELDGAIYVNDIIKSLRKKEEKPVELISGDGAYNPLKTE